MEVIVERKSKWGKVGKVVLIFVSILLLVAGIAYTRTDLPEASGAYQKNLDAATRLGLPMSAEDVDRLRQVPDKDNGASLVSQAEKNFVDLDHEMTNERTKTQSDSKYKVNYEYYAKDSLLAKLWPKLEPDYRRLEEASHRKYLVFKYDFRDPLNADTSDRGRFKDWIAIIVQRAHLAENAGDISLAKNLILTAARLATLIQDDKNFEGIFKRLSANTVITRELAKWTTLHGRSPAWRALVREAAVIIDEPFDLRPSLRTHHWVSLFNTERVVGLRMGKNPPEENGMDSSSSFESTKSNTIWLRLLPNFGRASVSRVHEYYAKAIETYPSDLWDFAALHRQLGIAQAKLESNGFDGFSVWVAGFTIPAFDKIDESLARCSARTNVILQALAILDSGQRTGKLPLSGHHAMDLDGLPIRYRKNSSGWVVYSVDRDKIDDGGLEVPDKVTGHRDFVVRLGR